MGGDAGAADAGGEERAASFPSESGACRARLPPSAARPQAVGVRAAAREIRLSGHSKVPPTDPVCEGRDVGG